uniref:protein PAXX isoform X3 n=1 Tax=Callithrix jacchus TaxID=9483 RepID=UPI0023DD3D79|nr:protein PAXX isoform X3 [Callithrix jacchus]
MGRASGALTRSTLLRPAGGTKPAYSRQNLAGLQTGTFNSAPQPRLGPEKPRDRPTQAPEAVLLRRRPEPAAPPLSAPSTAPPGSRSLAAMERWSLPLCTLPPGAGPPRFVCYCEGEGSGEGDRGGFSLYVTDAAELWSTHFTPDSLAALKAGFGLSAAEDITPRFSL